MSIASPTSDLTRLDAAQSLLNEHGAEWGIGDWSSVASLDQPGHDLGRVCRPEAFETEPAVRAAKLGTARYDVDGHNALDLARELYASLGITDDRLAVDTAALVAAFVEAFPGRPVRLRVDVCDTTTCPKFHHDHRYVRLVTTYFGPTTEYKTTDRHDEVLTAAPWELLLFKGAVHPTFGESVVHRSPPMSDGQRRLCVVIDC